MDGHIIEGHVETLYALAGRDAAAPCGVGVLALLLLGREAVLRRRDLAGESLTMALASDIVEWYSARVHVRLSRRVAGNFSHALVMPRRALVLANAAGMGVSAIAATFHVSEAIVERRLRHTIAPSGSGQYDLSGLRSLSG